MEKRDFIGGFSWGVETVSDTKTDLAQWLIDLFSWLGTGKYSIKKLLIRGCSTKFKGVPVEIKNPCFNWWSR